MSAEYNKERMDCLQDNAFFFHFYSVVKIVWKLYNEIVHSLFMVKTYVCLVSYNRDIKTEEVLEVDTKKIGMFLKELRNENGMTQEQLGEKIGVSNKTISRWETGNYMPPVDCLKMLSEIYHISINEILGGERASGDEFTKMAEHNITVTLKELEKDCQTFEKKMMCILAVTTVLTIIILILIPLKTVKDVIVMVLVVAVAFIANILNLVALATKKEILDNK